MCICLQGLELQATAHGFEQCLHMPSLGMHPPHFSLDLRFSDHKHATLSNQIGFQADT